VTVTCIIMIWGTLFLDTQRNYHPINLGTLKNYLFSTQAARDLRTVVCNWGISFLALFKQVSFIDFKIDPPALKDFRTHKGQGQGSIPSPWHEATTDSVWQRMAGGLGPLMRSHGFSAGFLYIYYLLILSPLLFLSFFLLSTLLLLVVL
jgi:hypothetical protein